MLPSLCQIMTVLWLNSPNIYDIFKIWKASVVKNIKNNDDCSYDTNSTQINDYVRIHSTREESRLYPL